MRGFLHSAGQRIQILRWYECGPEDTFIQFHDGLSVVSFLREFMNNPMNMATLRREVLELLQNSTDISRLTDHQILQQLSIQITCDYIRLVLKEDRLLQIGGEAGSSGGTTAEAVEVEETPSETEVAAPVESVAASEPPPVQETQPAVTPSESPEPTREIEVEEEPQPVELEQLIPVGAAAAQAATMTQAAQNGHPFCDT